MKSFDLKTLLLGGTLLAGSFAYAGAGFAQDQQGQQEDDAVIQTPDAKKKEKKKDEVVVTGSRIKKDTFQSVAPLQVITADTAIKAGLIDPAQILQQDESAAGQQIDATFQGFVLDNGPGSQTLNLRGLDPSRTLVLLNGRRLAPSGVEGAPVSASINTIPGSLVDRYDLLLDGASSVYGSDAVAGVANVILRKDFDGFELRGDVGHTQQGGNTDYTISANWGGNNDRGFIGIGVEYDFRDEVTLADRDYLSDCEKNVEITSDGQIRHRDIGDETRFSVWFGGFQAADGQGPLGACVPDGISGRLFEQGGTFGSIYNVGGTTTNIGIPGYVDQTIFGVPIDADNDGVQDYGFQQFSVNGTQLDRSFISEQKRASIMSYGEYTLEGDMGVTPYFEVLYTDTRVFADAGQPLLFPEVPAANPFNPCGINGQDCGSNSFNFDAAFIQRWGQYYADTDPNRDGDTSDARICARFGIPAAFCTPFLFGFGPGDFVGPQNVFPIVGIRGDRDQVETVQKNIRASFGIKGDLPQLSFGQMSDWTFDASVTVSSSKGRSVRRGIREDRLNFALGVDPNNPVLFDAFGNEFLNPTPGPCQANPGSPAAADVVAGCVPVNLFADSVARDTVGDFASQAERDYLFDERRFRTVYNQTVWNAFMTGKLFDVPAGSVSAVVGAEVRTDEIDSTPNRVAAEGLLFGFFKDRGAVGQKTTKEVFGELDIPMVANKPFFREFDVNLSGRVTNDEFYGTNSTYSIKGGWKPVDSLFLKGSFGTSFRAPNLRENFLLGQSGFTRATDPCVVPGSARSRDFFGNETYNPSGDFRDPTTIAACQREGVDPTFLGLNTPNTGTTQYEIFRVGTLDLEPETSKAFSLGFAFEQPWFDSFDLNVNMNYYRIEVNNSITEIGGQFVINSCFLNPQGGRSQFCDNITRGGNGAGFINAIDAAFENITSDVVRGQDFNIAFGKDFNAINQPMRFTLDLRVNHLLNRSFTDVQDDGTVFSDSVQGDFGFAKWRGTLRAGLSVNETFDLNWTTRYISGVEQDPLGVDEFGDALGTSGFFADTCGGTFVGDVTCRDVGFADDYYVHSVSMVYRADTWRVTAGISNIFDKNPPEVDGTEVFSISNVPIGNGYDLDGRRFFVTARKNF